MKQCGYADSLLRPDFRFGQDRAVDLAAFAHEPTDARSACVAVVASTNDTPAQVASCRELGCPIVLVLEPTGMQLWRQGKERAEFASEVIAEDADAFFRRHRNDLAPEAVYRAKTWGRLDRQFQLSFVDVGFMPIIEAEIGRQLTSLIERVVHGLRQRLWTKTTPIPTELGHWLVKSSFWLVAGKILRDKRVEGFITADLLDAEDLFRRIARHYDSRASVRAALEIRTERQRDALAEAAEKVDRFSHLGHVTTESLARVYESALITKETRAALGTHSTPQYLVDYLVWKLAPWISDIPVDNRHVFEPACGHAAFLVASMRLLKELLPADRYADRKEYLRTHLHGVEIDPFAREIARLSLTLADIPNPNGWDLSPRDVFAGREMEKGAGRAMIVLGNPPFENFTGKEKARYASRGVALAHNNKTAELLSRVLPKLQPRAVLGFVVPQGFLHSSDARGIRKLLGGSFEIGEICLFPDKVFAFSDAESAVVIARRVDRLPPGHRISYRRVREPDFDRFRLDYEVTTTQALSQNLIRPDDGWNMRVPDLKEVWSCLKSYRKLEEAADLGQGLQFRGRKLPAGAVTVLRQGSQGERGFDEFEVDFTHQLPPERRLNLDATVIRRRGTGTVTGCPQVLLNYAPASRGPWRLKALVDRQGHAVTSRFITVRPKSPDVPLEYLWALLNNPLANAYAYAWLGKRDILVGTMRKMPVPDASEAEVRAVSSHALGYLQEVRKSNAVLQGSYSEQRARDLLMELDAEVLRLYDLTPRLERELLDLFAGQQRQGVPFRFERYFPEDFEPWLHLHEYLSDEYARSTAGALRAHKDPAPPEVVEALRRAAEAFRE